MKRYKVYLCGTGDSPLVVRRDCPNWKQHTPQPSSYLDWHDWARWMSKGHRQVRCSGCDRYEIWKPKETRRMRWERGICSVCNAEVAIVPPRPGGRAQSGTISYHGGWGKPRHCAGTGRPPREEKLVEPQQSCRCGRIVVGSQVTEQRNWNPDCPEHGLESAWWNSPEQIEKRRIDNERLVDLQRRAAEARRQARGSL